VGDCKPQRARLYDDIKNGCGLQVEPAYIKMRASLGAREYRVWVLLGARRIKDCGLNWKPIKYDARGAYN